MSKKAFIASEQSYYDKLGLKKNVEPWEDALRTDGKEGSFEWWYFDAEYTNGTKVVAIFYTKKLFDIAGPANPSISFEVTFPDGRQIQKLTSLGEGIVIDASKEKCDLRIGDSSVKFVDGKYELHYVDHEDGVDYRCVMTPKCPMWRPGTGMHYMGEHQEHSYAWLVPLPTADVEGELRVKGEIYQLHGSGYHDHDWGDIAMNEIFNHWYWCRASIGPYTIVTSDIIAEKAYDYSRMIHFLAVKGDKIIADDSSKVVVKRENTVIHPETGKFIDNKISFIYTDDEQTVTLECNREKDMFVAKLLDFVDMTPEMRAATQQMGINPTYMRMIGTSKIIVEKKNGETESYEKEALWEQMFFGGNRDAIIGE